MDLITYDWETFYDRKQKYSLGQMTPEEYIRDERFQVILCTIKINNNPTEWKSATDPDFEEWLRSFPWETSAALAHNGAAFDHIVLGLHYDIHPELLLDTLQIARVKHPNQPNSLAKLAERYGLPPKGDEVVRAEGLRREDFTPEEMQAYGDYGITDTDLCYTLFHELKDYFTSSQFIQGHLFARMASRPKLVLDKEILRKGYQMEVDRKENLTQSTADKLGVDAESLPKVIRSNTKFAELLDILGAEVPMKISPTTGKQTYAFAKTDEDFIALQECGNELIESVVELRLGIKTSILETRLARFIGIAERGPSLPVFLRLHGAGVTGRASGAGAKQNLQNLAKHGVKNNALRESMKAPSGELVMAADSAQLEVRILGDITGDENVLRSFYEDLDPYKEFGYKLYGLDSPSDVTDEQRKLSKEAVLAAGFGQGGPGFQKTCQNKGLSIDEQVSQNTINIYRREHLQVVAFWKECGWALKAMLRGDAMTFGRGGMFETFYHGFYLPSGRCIRYNDLQWSPEWDSYVYREGRQWRRIYGPKICQNAVQATAYDAIAWQMIQIYERSGWEPALQVHDELVYVRPREDLETAMTVIGEEMSRTPPFLHGVPLTCEFGYGKSYADV